MIKNIATNIDKIHINEDKTSLMKKNSNTNLFKDIISESYSLQNLEINTNTENLDINTNTENLDINTNTENSDCEIEVENTEMENTELDEDEKLNTNKEVSTSLQNNSEQNSNNEKNPQSQQDDFNQNSNNEKNHLPSHQIDEYTHNYQKINTTTEQNSIVKNNANHHINKENIKSGENLKDNLKYSLRQEQKNNTGGENTIDNSLETITDDFNHQENLTIKNKDFISTLSTEIESIADSETIESSILKQLKEGLDKTSTLKNMTIMLKPQHLGTVNLNIKFLPSGMQINIFVDTDMARQAIENNINNLENLFSPNNEITIAGLNISKREDSNFRQEQKYKENNLKIAKQHFSFKYKIQPILHSFNYTK